MHLKDLLEFSPVRYFDNVTGGLKECEMGLVTAKKGLGKTSVLVQLGLDSLLNDKSLIHVSFDQRSSNVISWYSSVIAEIAKKKHLNDMDAMAEEIVRNRTILNFNQETFSLPKVANTIKALKEGGVSVNAIAVDDLDLAKASKEDLAFFADFVKSEKMTAWFSYTSESATLKDTLDADKLALFSTVCHLAPESNGLALSILKNNGAEAEGKVNLDAKTLLMSK